MLNVPPPHSPPTSASPEGQRLTARPPEIASVPPYTPPQSPQRRSNAWIGWLIGGIVGGIVLISLVAMLLASIVGWVITGSTATRFTATTTQSFPVATPATLSIQNPAGSVTIRQGSTDQVSVQVTKIIRTLNQSVATRELNNMVVAVTQSGNTIQVQSDYSPSFFDGVRSSRSVDLVITAPQETAVTLRVSAGNATIADLHGKMDLQLTAGNLEVTGAQVTDGSSLSTNAGNIIANVAMTPNASLSVKVNAGNVSLTLPAETPARLDAHVNVGSMTITGWSIPILHPTPPSAQASGALGAEATGTVQVQVNAGTVTVRAR